MLGGNGSTLTVAIHVETSITDGPGGDSALVVSDGTSRLVNQNDCRTTDLAALAAHGPADLHWLQYSGAIWYPMVYEMDDATMGHLVEAKIESQLTRAMRYVESIDARAVVPSAGPPCFLDPDLFHLNVVTGDEPSIFVDQRTFLARLAASGHAGVLAIPGTTIDVGPEAISVEQPIADDEVAAIFERKGAYLARYQADWMPWLEAMHERWAAQPESDLVPTLQEWWRPLLAACPTVREGIGAACLLRAVSTEADDVEILIDFPAGDVRTYAGEPYGFRFEIDRNLVEKVVADRAVDWSNSLFLSCRFRAWREDEFNEYVYNFFKSLSPGRMRRTEAEALRKLHPPTETEPDIELDGWVMQRRCPHRNADLSVFGEVHGCELVCTLHGWRFDLETGRCLTSAGHELRVRKPRRLTHHQLAPWAEIYVGKVGAESGRRPCAGTSPSGGSGGGRHPTLRIVKPLVHGGGPRRCVRHMGCGAGGSRGGCRRAGCRGPVTLGCGCCRCFGARRRTLERLGWPRSPRCPEVAGI